MGSDSYDEKRSGDMIDGGSTDETVAAVEGGAIVNAAGYNDQLKRQYSLVGLAGLAITIDNAWIALGSSISVSINNGGFTGIIFGLIVAAFYYSFIGLGLAEFASSVPTAGGVYHWATIAGGPKWGRILGFFTGWINFYGWMFDLAALTQITANISVNLYTVYHPDYSYEAWHTYVAYILITLLCTVFVIFANRAVPWTQNIGMFFVIVGGIVTIIVLAAMPKQHSTNKFVWNSMSEGNTTGYSTGLAFLLGVMNGSFTIGTPDAITHLAEEMPQPKKDLPKGIALQIGLGFLYAFVFAIVLAYAVTDIGILQDLGVNQYPLANIYAQATAWADGSVNTGAVFGLLFIIWFSSLLCCIGTFLTNSRIYWALARDDAVPLSPLFASVNETLSCPIPSSIFVGVICIGLGAIPLGSSTAFGALTGSFIILSSFSYAIPFLANVMTGRKYFPKGPFHLGKYGYAINIAAVLFICFFNILYCFPFYIPTDATVMNYNSVILAGVVAITAIWWVIHARKHYPGPKVMTLYIHDDEVVMGTPEEAAVMEAEHKKQ